MAAGKGTRLHSLTESIPKCLIPISDETTILDRQIDILLKNNIDDIFVVTGYKSNLIEKHVRVKNVKIVYNDKFEISDTLYSIHCATKYIKSDFVVLYGDLVFDEDVIISLLKNTNDGNLVTSTQIGMPDSHSVLIEDSQIKSINTMRKKPNGQFIGISKFQKTYVDLFKNILKSFSSDDDLEGEFVRIIESFVESNIPIHALTINQRSWVNVNDLKKLELAKKLIKS